MSRRSPTRPVGTTPLRSAGCWVSGLAPVWMNSDAQSAGQKPAAEGAAGFAVDPSHRLAAAGDTLASRLAQAVQILAALTIEVAHVEAELPARLGGRLAQCGIEAGADCGRGVLVVGVRRAVAVSRDRGGAVDQVGT